MSLTAKNTTASLGFRPGGQVVDLSGSTTFVFRADHSTRKFSTWWVLDSSQFNDKETFKLIIDNESTGRR